ncbi:MAG: methyl-accepting chemotaxis protein [Desulfovibrionales bacterium]|nr:methyl-accepting chemotaxis protein [Desulfovibrionales bacterium]
MRFKSLQTKLVLSISLLFLIFFGILIGGTTYYSRSNSIKVAIASAEQTATTQALLIKQQFDAGFSVARTLANTFIGLRTENIMISREQATEMIHNVTKMNPAFFGIWSVWEPGGVGDNDALYVENTEHSGPDGRFVPYWNKTKGYLSLYPAKSYTDQEPSLWYTASRDAQREIATNVTEFHPNGKTIKVSSLTVPIIVNNKSLGVVGADLSADFLSSVVNNSKEFDGKATITIISPDGIVQARTNTEDALHKPFTEYTANGNDLLKSTARGEVISTVTDDTLRVLVPVQFGHAPEYWTIALSVSKDIVLARAQKMTNWLIIGALLSLMLGMVCIYYFAKVIVTPILRTSTVVSNLSKGTLTDRCTVTSEDEIGTMQHAVNNLGETLLNNQNALEANMQEIEQRSQEAEEATKLAKEAQAEAQLAHTQGMLQAARQLEEMVEGLASVSVELQEQITATSNDVSEQDARNSETATAMEEMNCTILEVAKNANEAATNTDSVCSEAEQGIDVITKSVSTINEVHTHTESLKQELHSLGEQVTSISEIMNVISDIADQTNLLALNAAIEAARAGDAGRGFAVVADEVRKLAENTMNATSQVSNAVEQIQASAKTNIDAMEQTSDVVNLATQYVTDSGDTFTQIMRQITNTSEQVRAIATAATQQSAASEEINHAIGDISRISSDTSLRMTEAQQAMSQLKTLSDKLQNMIETMQQG